MSVEVTYTSTGAHVWINGARLFVSHEDIAPLIEKLRPAIVRNLPSAVEVKGEPV